MGEKYCAPGCRSYYDNGKEYVNIFKFPSDPERKKLWVRKLHRANFSPRPFSVMCFRHFDDRFIIREDGVKPSDGTQLVIPRRKIRKSSHARCLSDFS